MGLEFAVNKELATISVTLTELTSIAKVIQSHISNREFLDKFSQLIASTSCGYKVVIENFQPWLLITSEAAFTEKFEWLHEHYKATFLKEAGKSRPSIEFAYEQYQQLKTYKEFNTSFPLLKRTFNRLDEYIDKWIDNDTWLMMTLDRLFKMLSRLLQDISEYKRKDVEEAFTLFQQAFADFRMYIDIVQQKFVLLTQ